MACVTVPDRYNFLISHICCFCSTTCPYNIYTTSAACHLTDSTLEKASTERTRQEARTFPLQLPDKTLQSGASQPPPQAATEGRRGQGALGLDIWKNFFMQRVVKLIIRTDSSGSGWSQHPYKCSRNDCT